MGVRTKKLFGFLTVIEILSCFFWKNFQNDQLKLFFTEVYEMFIAMKRRDKNMKIMLLSTLLISTLSFGQEGDKQEIVESGYYCRGFRASVASTEIYSSTACTDGQEDNGETIKSAYYCHFRGSLTSRVIYSSKPNEQEACAEKGMEAGQSHPMQHTCLDEDGNIAAIIYSPLPKEEACEHEMEFADYFCKNNESFENCVSRVKISISLNSLIPDPIVDAVKDFVVDIFD